MLSNYEAAVEAALIRKEISSKEIADENRSRQRGNNFELKNSNGKVVIRISMERVEQLKREVEREFIDKQSFLKIKLDETEKRLKELQSESFQNDLFSLEEKTEIESFRNEQFRIRQELRSIQHDLYKNITTLENNIKIINIFALPIIIMIIGIIIGIFKPTRRVKISGTIN